MLLDCSYHCLLSLAVMTRVDGSCSATSGGANVTHPALKAAAHRRQYSSLTWKSLEHGSLKQTGIQLVQQYNMVWRTPTFYMWYLHTVWINFQLVPSYNLRLSPAIDSTASLGQKLEISQRAKYNCYPDYSPTQTSR